MHAWSDDQELFCGVDVAAAVAGEANHVRQEGVLARAATASQTGMTVLCLDEVDKVQERTENLLLDFLQTGRVPVQPGVQIQANCSNLVVFLTSNETRQLSDPILRRVRRVRMKPLPTRVVVELVIKRAKVHAGLAKLVVRLGIDIGKAEMNHLSVQEFTNASRDLAGTTESVEDVREVLSQWLARTDRGTSVIKSSQVATAIWAEVLHARRMEQAPAASGTPGASQGTP
jgi:MoxR-like ATPase